MGSFSDAKPFLCGRIQCTCMFIPAASSSSLRFHAPTSLGVRSLCLYDILVYESPERRLYSNLDFSASMNVELCEEHASRYSCVTEVLLSLAEAAALLILRIGRTSVECDVTMSGSKSLTATTKSVNDTLVRMVANQ
jgi:hypothetical protein